MPYATTIARRSRLRRYVRRRRALTRSVAYAMNNATWSRGPFQVLVPRRTAVMRRIAAARARGWFRRRTYG